MMRDNFLTRRNFLRALAASVIAAGLPLPVGVSERTHLILGVDLGTNDMTVAVLGYFEHGNMIIKGITVNEMYAP